MKKYMGVLALCLLCVSCKTIELKGNAKSIEEVTLPYVKEDEKILFDVTPVLIPNTTYVVVDKDELNERDEEEVTWVGKEAVKESLKSSIVPLKEFVGGNSIFDYNENSQFPIFTKKSAMTTILLNTDEAMIDTQPFMSDTENWIVTGDVWQSDKGERQLIMVKPKQSGLETNMLIVTNKRLYHFVLYSTSQDYQPIVSFKYKTEPIFITSHTIQREGSRRKPLYDDKDLALLNYDYEIQVPVLQKKVSWIPEKVYSDASHTYIKLPSIVLDTELPTVYEDDDKIINYQIHPQVHSLLVLNKRVNKATLKLGKEKVIIKKKDNE